MTAPIFVLPVSTEVSGGGIPSGGGALSLSVSPERINVGNVTGENFNVSDATVTIEGSPNVVSVQWTDTSTNSQGFLIAQNPNSLTSDFLGSFTGIGSFTLTSMCTVIDSSGNSGSITFVVEGSRRGGEDGGVNP